MRRLYLSFHYLCALCAFARHQGAWHLLPLYALLALVALFVPMERRWVQRPIVYAIF